MEPDDVRNQLVFRSHSVQRMFQRGINTEDVLHVLATGDVIEDYPDDTPYASRLLLGWRGVRPIHVVAADNVDGRETIVVTVYEPDLALWEDDFRRRRNT